MSDIDEDAAKARAAMDAAAKKAEADLFTNANLTPEAAKAIGAWWKKHYAAAGHKRLARIILEHA